MMSASLPQLLIDRFGDLVFLVLVLVVAPWLTKKWLRPPAVFRRHAERVKKFASRVGIPLIFAALIAYGEAFHHRDPGSWEPLVVLAAMFLIGSVPVLIAERRERRRIARQIEKPCPVCGYSLKENTSGICPECGTRITWHCPRCRAEVEPSATSCPKCGLTWTKA